MTIQFHNNEGEATLTLCGRLDTAVSMKVGSDIEQLLTTAGTIQRLTIDAGQLEYISSSGLRILLTLAKRFKQFRIVEVNPEIYDSTRRRYYNKGLS